MAFALKLAQRASRIEPGPHAPIVSFHRHWRGCKHFSPDIDWLHNGDEIPASATGGVLSKDHYLAYTLSLAMEKLLAIENLGDCAC